MKHRHHIFSLVFAVVLLLPLPVRAITSSYYNSINGQKETALRDSLYTITSVGPSGMSYDGLWTAYQTTDVYPLDSTGKAGKIWDMYSDCLFTPTGKGDGKQCGTYSSVCDCFNREHSLPKSWFNEKKPAYYDLGHIVPTDGKVNGMRSNNVFGECASGYATWGTGKLGKAKAVTTMNVKGSSTITTTFTGTAFEPADKYKGDFARMYMYMVIRYKPGNSNSVNLAAAGEGSTMFNSDDTNYGLTDYSIALLMKWHRQDPVSQKEIDRNNGMETTQGNRNPFIDYPCLAEYLWGNKAGQAVTLSELVGTFTGSWTSGDGCPCVGPTITSPTGTVNIGTTNTSNSIYKDVTVQGTNLENSSLILTIGGTNDSYFKLPGGASSTTITKAQAEAGYNITITYTPTANGSHTATLTISGCGVTSHVVTLTGTCTTVYTATWMADGSQVGTSYAASGTRPDVPASNPTNCSASRVFVGWTATSGYSGNSAPGDLFTTTAPTITTDKTFYAVYADKSTSAGGGTGSETLTCSAGTIDNNTMRFNTTNFSVEHAKGISANFASYSPWRIYNGNTVTISGSFSITSVVITCGSNDYAKVASNAKLTPTGGGTVSASASSTTCTITATGTVTSLVISPSAQTRWSEIKINYSGGGSITYSNYSTQCTACTPVAATASYASSTKATTVGGTVTNTFTTNSNATVSYASSNTSVATVASDGTVTPLSAGTTTITATVPENTCFTGGASASYTLTVYNFNATAATDVTCSSFTANWTSAGAASYSLDVYQATTGSITVSRDTTIAYDFTGGMYWAANDVSGTSGIWKNDPSYGNVGKGQSGTASESWLISPEMDFSDVTTASLSMNHTFRYGESSQLSVKYSIDGGSTWNNATLSNWGDVNNWTFVDATADLSATCGYAHVKLAFVYTCTTSSYSTWEIKTLTISGKYNKTTSTSSVTHVSGYPKNVSGTSASVTGLDASTTYKYTVTPQGGSASNEIEVTTPACSCTATITATSNDDSMGTVSVTIP